MKLCIQERLVGVVVLFERYRPAIKAKVSTHMSK